MLEEEGMAGKFDNIITQNDYFPESFFYQLLGTPEKIFLYNKAFYKYIQQKNTGQPIRVALSHYEMYRF